METKLSDFPCFYFTSSLAKRPEQRKYYASVAAMLGYTMKEAADSSDFFIKISKGKLFQAKAFSEEELAGCGNNIVTATSCSVNYSRLFASATNIVQSCCVLCPLSAEYANARLKEEYTYLKGIMDNLSLLERHSVDSSALKAVHSLTLSNDVGAYPVIPFNALFLDYLKSVDSVNPDTLHDDMVRIVREHLNMSQMMDMVLEELLDNFVATTLLQIKNSSKEPVSDTLMATLYLTLTSEYSYTPARNVLPVSEGASRPERKQIAKEISSQLSTDALPGQETAIEPQKAEETLAAEKEALLQEQGKDDFNDVVFPETGADDDTFWDYLQQQKALFESSDSESAASALDESESGSSMNPLVPALAETLEVSDSLNSDTIKLPEEDTPVEVGENAEEFTPAEEQTEDLSQGDDDTAFAEPYQYECENVTGFIEEMPDDLELPPPEETVITEASEASLSNYSCSTELSQSNEPISELDSVSSSESDEVMSEDINSATISASEQEQQVKMELSVVPADVCALCNIGASATFFNNVMRNATPSEYAFFLRCMSSVPGQETFASMKNRNGCALCPKKRNKDIPCVYPSLSFRGNSGKEYPYFSSRYFITKIDADMIPYVNDCTDSQKLNLIDFISEACNAKDVSVECVEYRGVRGLLFYVGGKFYFFDPAYGSSGFLKPLLSDATKTKFYSVNPIQVHDCFYKMGFKQTRIESIAALYSTTHNLAVLAPIGIIFEGYMHRALLDDVLAHIMPYYPAVYNKLNSLLNYNTRKEYENGLQLEWALGKNKDITWIAQGHENNVMGNCYLHYRVTMRHFEDLNVPGCLTVVKINNDIAEQTKKRIFERTAGKIAASTSRAHTYTFLVALSSENIAYYSCYETDVFFDELMACVRSSFREYVSGSPDIFAERTPFRF